MLADMRPECRESSLDHLSDVPICSYLVAVLYNFGQAFTLLIEGGGTTLSNHSFLVPVPTGVTLLSGCRIRLWP